MLWKLDDDGPSGSIYFFASSGDGTPLGWYTKGPGGAPLAGAAPFNAPFHLLLNLAVGGVHTFASREVCLATLEKEDKALMVDWVRVYAQKVGWMGGWGRGRVGDGWALRWGPALVVP